MINERNNSKDRLLFSDTKFTVFPAHKIGDIVYLITDEEQLKRQVMGYQITDTYDILYMLQHINSVSYHNEIEITTTKQIQL